MVPAGSRGGVSARSAALELLLGDRERSASAARVFGRELGWTPAIDVCSDWAALPFLRRRLDELAVALPPDARARLRFRANAVFLRSASILREGVRALAALADAGVDAAAFKGVAAIATLYGGAQGRALGDTDVLVRRDALAAAVEALERAGFRGASERSLAEHIAFIRDYPQGSEAVYMLAANGIEIDLHWHLGRVPVDVVLAAAECSVVYGERIRTVNRAHGFLLCVYHLLRNGFVLDCSLRDLMDCRGWLRAADERGESTHVIDSAAAWGLTGPSLAAVRILARFDGSAWLDRWASAFADRAAPAGHGEAEALAQWFWLQRGDDRWNLDLLRTLDGPRLLRYVGRTLRSAYTPAAGIPGVHAAPPLGPRLRNFGRALPRTRWRLLLALKKAQDRAFTPDV